MRKTTTIIICSLMSLMNFFASGQDSTAVDGCNSACTFSYSTDGQGVSTFSGQYSGSVTNPQFTWYVNGNVVGSGQNYSGNVANQTEVCFELEGYSVTFDSLQGQQIDTCYAIYCDIVIIGDTIGGTDSSATSDCGTTSIYSYSTNANGQTTFTGQYTGTTNPYFFWTVNGVFQGSNTSTFTVNNLADGDVVCFEVREYIVMFDSLNQWVDTCSAIYCNTFQLASLNELSQSVISLYPNPANDLISIVTKKEGTEVLITDVNGVVVLTSIVLSDIDISMLTKGLYYVWLRDANGSIVSKTERLIKV
ncbi:MAG: hypothetical protein A3D31_01405 [Candidatus Fluviicola riflensis]|nr:MAG: hypothetical protein CHH17_04135 [Candidatus Fluviicola riflensis]OGS76260.1 MAG: hypothetical protein A3D31_01405 [Candidatus Fluviicola riflensis]OGS83196.1 MAG: hypothetical protein A2724_00435 [Fluviicola sp. RIFCSPHIGHO2_01_FULL_43_53]OGS83792.1 MAG: hypothetical protein A3E30_18010 [Fluviicola sp. RIFCSPHIGHO2_12_FULL_43_24]